MGELLDIVSLGQDDEALADGIGLRRSTLDSHHPVARHTHNFHGVTLILSSPGHVEWHFGEGQEYSGRPSVGDVVICPAFMPTLARWERPFESISVRLSTGLLDRVAERAGLGLSGLRPAAMRRDPFAGEIARKLADDASADRRGRAILAESLGTALAVHLLREYGDEDGRARRRAIGLPDGTIRRVTDHIERHLDGDLSVDRLADLAGLSPYHFIRLFRAATGTTPRQYVIRRRVERARELLTGGSGIAEAAARVGFSSQSHLHRYVRRLLGLTPGELAGDRTSATGPPQ
jgi:AraC family transcriptional regulator